jgi:hypothetical protein
LAERITYGNEASCPEDHGFIIQQGSIMSLSEEIEGLRFFDGMKITGYI